MYLLCMIGWHSWSAFLHVPSRCVDERFCKGCEKTEAKARHRWGKWVFQTQETNSFVDGKVTVTGQYTVQKRVCQDCNFMEFERAHAT